jgi:phage gp36-like protein
VAYSKVEELLLGNVPLPTGSNAIKAQNAVDRAADEIDGAIGMLYKTPIVATGPNQRAVAALMRNVSNWLASGRLIEELTASTQRVEVHAYAQSLIAQAWAILNQILSGQIVLSGVPSSGGTEAAFHGPMILNKDTQSPVDIYYDNMPSPVPVYISGDVRYPYQLGWREHD